MTQTVGNIYRCPFRDINTAVCYFGPGNRVDRELWTTVRSTCTVKELQEDRLTRYGYGVPGHQWLQVYTVDIMGLASPLYGVSRPVIS